MLKSSLLILFFSNLYFSDVRYITAIMLITLLLNIRFNKNIKENMKYIKFIIIFYMTTSIFQIFFNQNGVVIFKIFGIYITEDGIKEFLVSFLRMINLILISWLVSYNKIFSRFGKYQRVVECVILIVPEVIILFKKRMRIKWFLRHILKILKEKI